MPTTSFFAMGSKISIEISADSPKVQAALISALSWFRTWEASFSRFLPDSELCRLNERSGQKVSVTPEMGSLLRSALRGARQTGGLVNPTQLAALEAAGYDRPFEQIGLRERPVLDRAPDLGADSWKSVILDANERTVFLPAGVRLDLGGYAKGWAAGRAAQRLGKLASALVNAGGDIAVSGPREDGQPWLVGVGCPHDDSQRLAVLPLLHGGVATSGRNYRKWMQDGIEFHHLIDPRTGQPAETDVLTATVVAPSALEAEVAAKAVFILGSAAGMKWLNRRPALAGILVREDGSVQCSPSLSGFVLPDSKP